MAEALAGFRPARAHRRRDRARSSSALGRVPAAAILAPEPLPGFDRSTVDGYAVRAADTFGASEGIPSYLDVARRGARWARAADAEVDPAPRSRSRPAARCPPGADAVVMIEHTQEAMAGTIEVVRPVAPGEGIVRADEDVRRGRARSRPRAAAARRRTSRCSPPPA